MRKLPRRLAVLAIPLTLLAVVTPTTASAAPGDRYPYNQPGDKNSITNTNVLERFSPTGANNQSYKVTANRAQANAAFTRAPIAVDGVRDAAWDAAPSYPISHKFNTTMTADAPAATTEGSVRLLWDGPVLYALVQVTGDSTESDTATPNWNVASYTPTTDGLFVSMDVFNDQWGMETDTQGTFFLGANPALTSVTSFNNAGIPSLGSFFNPNNQDYSTRLKAFKSSGYTAGTGVNYTYEIALQTEGWGDTWDRALTNGTQLGLEFGIFNQAQSFTYWSKTQFFAGQEGGSNLPNSERIRNRDWGVVTLSGWDGTTPPAYSGWRADEDIRFWNSKNNPGGSGNGTLPTSNGDGSLVWTPETRARMVAAKSAYLAIRDSPTATRADKEAAVLEVVKAFAGLKWADTRYPDPKDLPATQTLPNVLQFFDPAKGTNGMVTNSAQWAQRKQEILDLAQFYEYGYKPRLGIDYTVTIVTNAYAGTGNPTVTAQVVPTNANFAGGVPVNVTIPVTLPATVPSGQKAVVAFSGGYTANGIANVTFPNWGGDNRSDTGAWGNPNRVGTFYTLFPYARNSTSADSSILIANATAVSVYLDILQKAVAANPNLAAKIDPSKAITKGFSINGKEAFVAAVFDDRVKAVVEGGAGATGPANWRYNVQGQEYNFTGTPFFNPGADNVVSFGTEGPGNSYRHNRVRETELFRHFMPYGHMYAHEDGSYAYADYSRLPFDQASLVATLAPDRAIVLDNNLNDFNDGAATDNLSMQIAKGVYRNLGVDPNAYVKFNVGNYVSAGDPHGSPSPAVEGRYLSDLFYGTQTLTTDDATRLNSDPYALNVANGQTQTPYDYYWGGYNTITGGQNGTSGADGWYFAGFDAERSSLQSTVASLTLDDTSKAALTTKLNQVAAQLSRGRSTQAAAVFTAFVSQVNDLKTQGKLTITQAAALTQTADELILNINTATWPAQAIPPTAITVPSISGTAEVNRILTASTGTWDLNDLTFTDQWLADGQPIGGATGTTLLVTPDLAGRAITVQVTASTDGLPPGSATSAPVTVKAVPAWSATAVYNTGDQVVSNGKLYQALWWTQNQAPGDPNGAWQELAVTADGSTAWTASRIFNTGDQVVYLGKVYKAQWWTRNQTPGDPNGPWMEIATTPDGTPAWTSTAVFVAGDRAVYQGKVYEAKWWTRGQTPGDPNGPWKPID